MAAVKTERATTLQLRVITGVKMDGSKLFATRTLSHINPVLTDDDAYQVAFGLAAMQKCELSSVHRVDSAVLEAE